MTRPLRITIAPTVLASALFAASLLVSTPASAGPTERAVAECRAQMRASFPDGAIRSYRVAEIAGTSRRPRVTINVTADRRYRFECAADADGRIVTASFDPPRGESQLASGQR